MLGDAWHVCEMGATNLCLLPNGAMTVLGAAMKCHVSYHAPSHVKSKIMALCIGIEHIVMIMMSHYIEVMAL